MRKEETTLKLLGNTAVDHFLKKGVEKQKVSKFDSWGVFFGENHRQGWKSEIPWLRDTLFWFSLCHKSPCSMTTPHHKPSWSTLTAFPPHSHSVNGNSPQLSKKECCSHTSACDWAAGTRARSPHCPHQVFAQRAPDTPWLRGWGHLRAWARCSQGKQRHREEQGLAILTWTPFFWVICDFGSL